MESGPAPPGQARVSVHVSSAGLSQRRVCVARSVTFCYRLATLSDEVNLACFPREVGHFGPRPPRLPFGYRLLSVRVLRVPEPDHRRGGCRMTDATWAAGARLRLARQARGLSQQQLAGMAAVTRQAVSAVESGHSDPSLRVALALARALGLTVEELFGPGDPADPVLAQPVAPVGGEGSRVALATVGDTFVALPLSADTLARAGFGPAGGLVVGQELHGDLIAVRPIAPPRPTLVVAGCDPALPLLETPLALLDPPLGFTWWPCGNGEALRLAAAGLVHAAGVHQGGDETELPDRAELVGLT